ncbi:cyclic nucleotide-binding domain-containing protein [Myxococcota bacterium]|nr:cyclic nucleotide-binding domain-containing protein [Myxococcota bacterium]
MSLLERCHDDPPTDAESPFELRSAPRVACNAAGELRLGGMGTLACRLRDVGTGGICIQTPSPFALSSLRSVTIHLPGESLTLDIEGCWQREASLERAIFTGLRFSRPTASDRERMRKFVEQAAQELTDFLQNRSELRDLGLDEALDVALASRLREAPPGTFICREGHPRPGDDSLFVVMRGTVTLAATGDREHELEVERVSPGGVFGGIPLIADVPSPVSAVAVSDVILLELDRAVFRYLERAKPLVAHRLARTIAARQVLQFRALVSRLTDQNRRSR